MHQVDYTIYPIGLIRSELTDLMDAPLQGDEGAPEAWVELTADASPGLHGIVVGDELFILAWLHLAQRDVLEVHPRDNPASPLTGVFATRSADRPNPIGLHRVMVLEITSRGLRVGPLEAVDGTPVIDIKPVLGGIDER